MSINLPRKSALLFLTLLVPGMACRTILGIEELPADATMEDAAIAFDAQSNAVENRPEADTGESFCETRTPRQDFCADFEDGNLKKGWINENSNPDESQSGGGELLADYAETRASVRAARFQVPALVTEQSRATAFLTKVLTRVPRYMRIEFSMFIGTESFPQGSAARVPLFAIDFAKRQIGAIQLVRDVEGLVLEVIRRESGSLIARRQPLAAPVAVGRWHDVVVLIKNYPVGTDAGGVPAGLDAGSGYGGNEGKVTVIVDGPQAELYLPPSFQASDQAALPWFTIGPIASGPMGPFRVNFDNVAYRFLDDGP